MISQTVLDSSVVMPMPDLLRNCRNSMVRCRMFLANIVCAVSCARHVDCSADSVYRSAVENQIISLKAIIAAHDKGTGAAADDENA